MIVVGDGGGLETENPAFAGRGENGKAATGACAGCRSWWSRRLCSRNDMPCSVGRMTIVDADTVQPTNINRQLPALHSTMGREKAEVLAARFKDINPDIQLTVLPVFLKDDNIPELLDAARYDFIVDAIDTLAPKCYLMRKH